MKEIIVNVFTSIFKTIWILMVSFIFEWIFSLVLWFAWTYNQIGSYYFPFLPTHLQSPTLFGIIGITVSVTFIRHIFTGVKKVD